MISHRVTTSPLTWLRTLTALACLALLPGIARAADRPAKAPHKRAPSHAKGLFIAIDPVTHRPTTPTPEQIRAWNDQRAHDGLLAPARPMQTERLPNGAEIIHL